MTTNPKIGGLKAQAQRDLDDGRSELFEDIKRTPQSELHNIDPKLLVRLSPEQRAKLFARTDRNSRPKHTPLKPVKTRKRVHLPRRAWNALPTLVRSQLTGVFITACVSVLMAFAFTHEDQVFASLSRPNSLSRHTSTWPPCGRLNLFKDGCTYTVMNAMSWNKAANDLGLDPNTLLSTNQHLAHRPTLYRGDVLTVWRGQIPLEN